MLNSRSKGNASVNTLIDQEYMALREQNISRRHATVSPSGPATASCRLMVRANSPVARRWMPTCSGRWDILYDASRRAKYTTGAARTNLRRRNNHTPIRLMTELIL